MDSSDLDAAREALRKREKISVGNRAHIGSWSRGSEAPESIQNLPQWAESRGIDAAIWTGLPSKFQDKNGQIPTCDQVIGYLAGLTGAVRDAAERYIRWTPRQIDTYYRRNIEAALQWTPQDPGSL
jgi:hypothetical protein